MKKIVLCLLVGLTFQTSAQLEIYKDFSYSLSAPYEVVDGIKAYFSKDGEVMSIKYGGGKFTIQRFGGPNLDEVKRKEIPKSEGFTMEGFEEVDGHYYFFYSIWDKKAQREQLFSREIDFENCVFVDEGNLLIGIDGKVTGGFNGAAVFGFGNYTGSSKFNFTKSYDDKVLMVQYRARPEIKDDSRSKDIIGMHVYDAELNVIWEDAVEMPYTEKKMNNTGFTVDSKGNAYILATVYNDETTNRYTKSGDPNYHMELIKVNADDQTLTHTEMELGGKFIHSIDFFEGRSNEIVLAGFYGNQKRSGADGMFMAKLEDDEVKDERFYEIPVDVMKKYMSDRAQDRLEKKDDRGDLSMSNLKLRYLTFDETGGVSIYGEEHYVQSHYNAQTRTYTYTYHYEDIIAARIDGNGDLVWMDKFPKRQMGSNGRGGMGYYVTRQGENEFILFLDNIKNIELALNQVPKLHKDGAGGFLTGFKVNRETGDAEKVSLFDTRDAQGTALYQFNTGRIVTIDESSFAVECYIKKKQDCMVKVNLE